MDFTSVLDLIEKKGAVYGASVARCDKIRKDMNNFEVNVVVVGAFSAGKSAMLNAFLGSDIFSDPRQQSQVSSCMGRAIMSKPTLMGKWSV